MTTQNVPAPGTTPTPEQQAEIRYLSDLVKSHQNLYTLCQSLLLMAAAPTNKHQTSADRRRMMEYFTDLIEREHRTNPTDRVAAVQRLLAS